MKKIYSLRYLNLIVICALLTSCSMMLSSVQHTKFKTTTPGAGIAVSGTTSTGFGTYETPYTEIGKDSGTSDLSNSANMYVIKQKKKGYRPLTTIILRKKFNSLKYIDIAIPVAATAAMVAVIASASSSYEDPFPTAYVPLTASILGWTFLFSGPWKVFDKSYTLPALYRYPVHADSNRYLYINKVNVNIDTSKALINYYSTLDNFMHNNIFITAPEKASFHYKDIEIKNDLNNKLVEQNYIDTLAFSKLTLNDYNWVKVDCDITGITWNTVSSLSCLDVTCSWKVVESLTGKELMKKTITTRSNCELGDWNKTEGLLIDALTQGMMNFVDDADTRPFLSKGATTFDKTFDNWDTKTIATGNNFAANMTEAAKAVVTIQLQDGHGSGCLISPDGYIVTNCHVTSDTNSTFNVIFQNGVKHTGKFVRANPAYDLAIIKVDTLPEGTKPLHLGNENTWSIGSDVFAIGTPGDIELGQTLTKGIVSATRKIGDMNYIQTDVSISPGNSGGALLTHDELLIGIVTAKMIGKGVSGIGFAIPSTYIEKALKVKLL